MRRALPAGALALGLLVGACGLPDDREPQLITADEEPLDLDRQNPAIGASSGPAEVALYFVGDGKLVEVTRAVEAETVEQAIRALLARPTAEEAAANLRSEIPAETELLGAVSDGGVATINLGCTSDDPTGTLPSACGIQGAEGTAQLTLFGQLVCTADAVPGIEGVLFQQEGTAQPAPTDGGLSTGAEPVRCSDYRSVQ